MIDEYLREVESSLRVDAARKRQIVDELRSHLTEKVDELQAAEPMRARADIEQMVLRDFGDPRDLALAYEPEGGAVLMNSAGEIVLRFGKAFGRGAVAAGRGAGKALKWVAIGLAGLLIISVGVGAWAYHEVKPYIPSIIEQSEPAYQFSQSCHETPCNGVVPTDAFYVHPEARKVRFDLEVWPVHDDDGNHVGNGTIRVTVTDNNGTLRFDRTFNGTDGYFSEETSWAAGAGNWTLSYAYEGFRGSVSVQAYAISVPWGDDAYSS
ncbi:MAG TPA: hypothetical protein VM370_02050 [Candidatus Thermoplasmatota archaeon]|nr:hypothetical protein [Candidatus Thermoplasmatota archaeon]